ncbi:MAG: hypothetical protein QOI95_3095 [Acidimicrobiaceae bacterium]|jgi:hypothetical protein
MSVNGALITELRITPVRSAHKSPYTAPLFGSQLLSVA